MKTLIGLNLTDDQGYALAELVACLTDETLRPFARDDQERSQMCTALTELQLALEFAGYEAR